MNISDLIKDSKANIIDVREKYEYDIEHIPNAKNIPLSVLGDKLEDFKNMEGPIVLYCRSGNRSGQALGFLKIQGLEAVYNGGGLKSMKEFLVTV